MGMITVIEWYAIGIWWPYILKWNDFNLTLNLKGVKIVKVVNTISLFKVYINSSKSIVGDTTSVSFKKVNCLQVT